MKQHWAHVRANADSSQGRVIFAINNDTFARNESTDIYYTSELNVEFRFFLKSSRFINVLKEMVTLGFLPEPDILYFGLGAG